LIPICDIMPDSVPYFKMDLEKKERSFSVACVKKKEKKKVMCAKTKQNITLPEISIDGVTPIPQKQCQRKVKICTKKRREGEI
jgi:hypothetical protein